MHNSLIIIICYLGFAKFSNDSAAVEMPGLEEPTAPVELNASMLIAAAEDLSHEIQELCLISYISFLS